jgi:metal-sulfur cluster biosynthetic enzyme
MVDVMRVCESVRSFLKLIRDSQQVTGPVSDSHQASRRKCAKASSFFSSSSDQRLDDGRSMHKSQPETITTVTTDDETMNGGPKENANPLVLSVDQTSARSRRTPLGWSQIESLIVDPAKDDEWDYDATITTDKTKAKAQRTPEDWAVLQALADVSAATNGEGVSLLRNVGLVIPERAQVTPRHPSFIPASERRAQTEKETSSRSTRQEESKRDVMDADEIFEIIRNIQDPEHPLTLEQLGVVSRKQCEVHDILDIPENEWDEFALSTLEVRFTPTIPHCSMATLIGLSIRVKLLRSMPPRFKVTVRIEPGSHASEQAVNKQLADKERVCAALENKHLLGVVNKCIKNGMTGNMT